MSRADDVIFGELCQGRLVESSRAEYIRIIDGLRREGCDAVALSCTAVATALGERTAEWRGGRL